MYHCCQIWTKVFSYQGFLLLGPSKVFCSMPLFLDPGKIFLLKTIVARFKESSPQLYASRLPGFDQGFFKSRGCKLPASFSFLVQLLPDPHKMFLLKTTVARFKESSPQLYASRLPGPDTGFFLSQGYCCPIVPARFFLYEPLLQDPGKIFCYKIPASITLGVGATWGRNFIYIFTYGYH